MIDFRHHGVCKVADAKLQRTTHIWICVGAFVVAFLCFTVTVMPGDEWFVLSIGAVSSAAFFVSLLRLLRKDFW